jgi:membrane fusion protein (multidrug efflux system)
LLKITDNNQGITLNEKVRFGFYYLHINNRMRYISMALISVLTLASCKEDKPVTQAGIPSLPVVEVTVDEIEIEKEFVGQVYGKVDIPIRARVDGFLEGIHFDEGRKVTKGQLLYTIDAQPFQAAVAEAKSGLAEAKIALVKAENDYARIKPLADVNAVSQSDLDAAIAEKGAAEAAVEAAQANVQMAEIQLSYTQIVSPINGLIGKTGARVGEYVGREPNPVILNTVSRIDTMRVDFYITENDYLRLARMVMKEREAGGTERKPQSRLKLVLGDGSVYEEPGKMDFIDRGVEESTGSILIQSSFPNSKNLLRPGQFAKVRAVMDKVENGILVPQRAVSEFQGKYFVWAVRDSNTIAQQPIQVRDGYRDYYLVDEGLKPGDKVVFEGLQQVKAGMTIIPIDTVFQSQYEVQ